MTIRLADIKRAVADLAKPAAIAELFCELDDDAQAQFFVHVARIAATWPVNVYGANAAEWQADKIGKHLRDCACSTEGARKFVRGICEGMEP